MRTKKERAVIDLIKATLHKFRIENFKLLEEAISLEFYFGTCPCGRGANGYFNVGRDHWYYCDYCKVRWCIGSNLFSSWKNETKKDWDRNKKKYGKYKEIKPAYWHICYSKEKEEPEDEESLAD